MKKVAENRNSWRCRIREWSSAVANPQEHGGPMNDYQWCLMLLLKVSTAKLKKFEKEYSVMKEQQEDPLERLQVFSFCFYTFCDICDFLCICVHTKINEIMKVMTSLL